MMKPNPICDAHQVSETTVRCAFLAMRAGYISRNYAASPDKNRGGRNPVALSEERRIRIVSRKKSSRL